MIERTKISLGSVWEEAFAFCKAEAGLLAPLALLGFGLPLVVLELVIPADMAVGGRVPVGPWMAWIPLHMLLNLLGTLSISALTARPGISVREALTTGLARLPASLGFALVALGAFVAMWVVVGIVAGIEMTLGGKPGAVSMLIMLAGFVLFFWASLRLLPIWAAIVAGRSGGWITMRATLALTRGLAPWMLLVRIVQIASMLTVTTVLTLPTHAIFDLIGRLTGMDALADLMATLVSCVFAAALMALWTAYVAFLYRRMTGASSGI